MGNSPPRCLNESTGKGKVILSNGDVFKYEEPLTVAELMLEHPQQVVVEFQPLLNRKKPTPLPADKKLEMKKVYLMLPVRKGKPDLSSEQAQKLLANTFKSKALLSYTGFFPLFVRICPAITSAGEGKNVVLNKRAFLVEEKKEEYFNEILEGRPELLSRQISGKGWKPSLDTIKEKTIKAKVHHWLISM